MRKKKSEKNWLLCFEVLTYTHKIIIIYACLACPTPAYWNPLPLGRNDLLYGILALALLMYCLYSIFELVLWLYCTSTEEEALYRSRGCFICSSECLKLLDPPVCVARCDWLLSTVKSWHLLSLQSHHHNSLLTLRDVNSTLWDYI